MLPKALSPTHTEVKHLTGSLCSNPQSRYAPPGLNKERIGIGHERNGPALASLCWVSRVGAGPPESSPTACATSVGLQPCWPSTSLLHCCSWKCPLPYSPSNDKNLILERTCPRSVALVKTPGIGGSLGTLSDSINASLFSYQISWKVAILSRQLLFLKNNWSVYKNRWASIFKTLPDTQ